MRISDWSSDVCSSDLLAAGKQLLCQRLTDHRDMTEIFEVVAHVDLIDIGIGEVTTRDQLQAQRFQQRPRGEVERDIGAGIGLCLVQEQGHVPIVLAERHLVGGGNRLNTGKRSEALRSEEHTSELQSLMRISYAVFCLKKTKH